MGKAPNQRDIAKAAGVCPATVSLALRNHSSIPEATRKRIREVADAMGYRPNPRVAELMGQIRRNRSVEALKERAALIWPDVDETFVSTRPHLSGFQEAVTEALHRNGIGLEVMHRPDSRVEALERMLHTRGIRGVILAPLFRSQEISWEWNWRNFSVVIAGTGRCRPDFHRVRFNHFADMRILVLHLLEEGRTRMGLEVNRTLEERSRHAISGGFWAEVPPSVRTENAIFDSNGKDQQAFADWIAAYQPDSLILSSFHILKWVQDLKSPPAVYLRSLENTRGPDHPPGIRQKYRLLGSVSAERLMSQLQVNQYGVPDDPIQSLIAGEWCPGGASG